MTSNEFAPPVVPKSDNSTGDPMPPSGLHPSDPKPAVITKVGTDGLPQAPAAENVHGTPAPPSGSHGRGSAR
jgi:hypothetical protein